MASVTRSDLYDADEALIRELYPSLHRFAAAMCPLEVEPDELLQEALYQVLRGGGLSDIPYPAAYLRRTISNLLAKHWRSAGRRRRAWSRTGVTEPTQPQYRAMATEPGVGLPIPLILIAATSRMPLLRRIRQIAAWRWNSHSQRLIDVPSERCVLPDRFGPD